MIFKENLILIIIQVIITLKKYLICNNSMIVLTMSFYDDNRS